MPAAPSALKPAPEQLGCPVFRERHGLRYAYVAGSMFKGIASSDLVIAMGRAGMLGYLGTGGLKPERIEAELRAIQGALAPTGAAYGMNLLATPFRPDLERACVDLFLRYGVPRVEASAFTQVTPDLVRYRLTGLTRGRDGRPQPRHHVLAKVSRPEVARAFLSPPPAAMVGRLLACGEITREAADLAPLIPVAADLCVEADSGGHTDQGVLHTLLPVILDLRDELSALHQYPLRLCIGAAGGLGTPHAMAAALVLGADFLLTGSINQCTVEAGTSDAVKELLAQAEVQDTELVPAGDLFETGAKVQVFRKGLLFPARAKKLYDLYRQHPSLDALDAATREQLEKRYFQRSLEAVYAETRAYYERTMPEVIEAAERNPKKKMALVFRWYFVHSTRLAMRGEPGAQVDYQIHCGPALGAFNRLVRGTPLEPWRARHVDAIALFLLQQTSELLKKRFHAIIESSSP